ncbi:MAG TPA: hypothetical protein QGH10_12540 [Armatimonadota bacterium]|jgi:hypothetical protein|nr:hypothetical protein [Armatimonadota bacterium]
MTDDKAAIDRKTQELEASLAEGATKLEKTLHAIATFKAPVLADLERLAGLLGHEAEFALFEPRLDEMPPEEIFELRGRWQAKWISSLPGAAKYEELRRRGLPPSIQTQM